MTLTIRKIIQKIHDVFPLSSMGKDFRGTHSIYIDRDTDRLSILIWWKGNCWPVKLSQHEEALFFYYDETELNQFFNDCKAEIEKRIAKLV